MVGDLLFPRSIYVFWEPVSTMMLADVDSLGGKPAWLYSSPYEWGVLDLIGTFPSRDGWCASYDGVSNLNAPSFGQVVIKGKQYSDHGQVPGLGFEVDLSLIELDTNDEDTSMFTKPVVNSDFITLLQNEAQGGVIVLQSDTNPKQYLVTLP